MNHDDILELIPAYALGSLDDQEALMVADHLPHCADCRAELSRYEEVTGLLPLAVAQSAPPAALRGRLMDRVSTPVRVTGPTHQVKAADQDSAWSRALESLGRFLSGPRWQPAGLLIIIALVVSNVLLWQQWQEAEQPSPLEQRFLYLRGTETAPDSRGIIYVSKDGRLGTLVVEDLPQLDPEKQYQLWLIDDGQRTSGGVFSVSPDGYHSLEITAPQPLSEYASFGITIEPAGGSPGPTGDRVLGYNL